MSSPSPLLPQMGGVRVPVLEEIQIMVGYIVLVALVLISVYVSRIPNGIMKFAQHPVGQIVGFVLVVTITMHYGWIHGVLAALAYALVVSRANQEKQRTGQPTKEGLIDYVPAALIMEESGTTFVPQNHRWFVEKVMGENPFLIREKEVRTTAVQDLSERSMGASNVTR